MAKRAVARFQESRLQLNGGVSLTKSFQANSRVPRLALTVLLTSVLAACHRQAVTRTSPELPREEYCWWAVHRSPLPADSVALRFYRAFEAVGLPATSQKRLGDTIWVYGGPRAGGVESQDHSRAVAYWDRDSTRYRYYVTLAASADSGPTRLGSPNLVALCGQIAKAAAIPGSTPREPTGEESLAVWTRRP